MFNFKKDRVVEVVMIFLINYISLNIFMNSQKSDISFSKHFSKSLEEIPIVIISKRYMKIRE